MADFKILVDGEEVLKILTDTKAGYGKLSRDLFVEVLKYKILSLPAYGRVVERIKGKWCGSVCSACGESVSEWFDCKFCPRCGAEMEDYEDE